MTAFVPSIEEADLKKVILSIQQIAAGRSNAVGSVTLTAGAASTVVTDNNFAPGSVPRFTPTTANAAAEIGNGTMYVSARANKSFTITHANNAQADRTFLYAIQG
jgi:hypothetical protein